MKVLVLALVALIFGSTLSTFPGWFDSGEFATAATFLGISHPSGHPLYMPLGKLFTWLPLGSIDLRLALLSLLSTVVAAALFWTLLRRLLQSSPFKDTWPKWIIAFPATCMLFHPSIALQTTRTEVYALQLAFSLGILLCSWHALQKHDPRFLFLSAFLAGLAFALQPLLTVIILPVLLIPLLFLILKRHLSAMLSSAFGLLGGAAYVFMPVRASTHPLLNWDAPSTWSSFWAALTARDFRIFFHSPVSERAGVDFLQGDLWRLLPWATLLLAVLGLLVFVRPQKRWTMCFLTIAFSTSLLAWLLKNFFLKNPDAHAYVTLPITLALLLSTIGAMWILQRFRWPSVPKHLAVSALVTLPFLPILYSGLSASASHGNIEAEVLSRHLDHLPPKASVFIESDHWLFPLWYRTYVEGRRPDVAIVGQGLLRARWYHKQIRQRYGLLSSTRAFYERPPSTDLDASGFLFGPAASPSIDTDGFIQSCQKALTHDPFQTRHSICAKVALNTATGLKSSGKTIKALALLEASLGLEASDVLCPKTIPLHMPFPLLSTNSETFLLDPSTLKTELALTYLLCGHPQRAKDVLTDNDNTLAANHLLLLSFLSWSARDMDAAQQILQTAPSSFSNREGGFLSLASATLYFLDERYEEADQQLSQARALLGRPTEVTRLEQQLTGKRKQLP